VLEDGALRTAIGRAVRAYRKGLPSSAWVAGTRCSASSVSAMRRAATTSQFKSRVYDETGASSCAWAARSLSQILTMAAMSSSSSGSMKCRRMASSKVRATFRL
jgi:hypothetical protein